MMNSAAHTTKEKEKEQPKLNSLYGVSVAQAPDEDKANEEKEADLRLQLNHHSADVMLDADGVLYGVHRSVITKNDVLRKLVAETQSKDKQGRLVVLCPLPLPPQDKQRQVVFTAALHYLYGRELQSTVALMTTTPAEAALALLLCHHFGLPDLMHQVFATATRKHLLDYEECQYVSPAIIKPELLTLLLGEVVKQPDLSPVDFMRVVMSWATTCTPQHYALLCQILDPHEAVVMRLTFTDCTALLDQFPSPGSAMALPVRVIVGQRKAAEGRSCARCGEVVPEGHDEQKKCGNGRAHLMVKLERGQKLDVCEHGAWYVCTILRVVLETRRIKIRWDGWPGCDQWFKLSSPALATLGTHTNGGDDPADEEDDYDDCE